MPADSPADPIEGAAPSPDPTTTDIGSGSPEADPSSSTAAALPAFIAAVATAVGSVLWIAWAAGEGGVTSRVVLGLSFAGLAATVVLCRTVGEPPMRWALVLAGCTLAVTVVFPLHHSRDMYLYDMYGRTAVVHGENPFDVPPEGVDDPVVEMVREQWRSHPAMYGPAFVALASGLALIGGVDELLIRITWQTATAAAAFAAVVLVARRTRSSTAVLALALLPTMVAAVGDAHADVIVGLTILGAVLLADRRALAWSGVVAGIAVSTKVVALFPLVGLGWWVLRRHGTRGAARWSVPLVLTAALLHLPLLGTAFLTTLQENSGDGSRFALWRQLRTDRMNELLGGDWSSELLVEKALAVTNDEYSRWSMLLLVPVLTWLLWRFRDVVSPAEMVVVTGTAWMLCATYVMPWYAPLILPVGALVLGSRVSLLLWLQAAFISFGYAEGAGRSPTTWLGEVLELRTPVIIGALLVALVVWARPSATVSSDANADGEGAGRIHRVDPART